MLPDELLERLDTLAQLDEIMAYEKYMADMKDAAYDAASKKGKKGKR